MRQRNLHDFSTQLLQLINSLTNGLFHIRVHALYEVFLRNTHLQALNILHQSLGKIRYFLIYAGGIHFIAARNNV